MEFMPGYSASGREDAARPAGINLDLSSGAPASAPGRSPSATLRGSPEKGLRELAQAYGGCARAAGEPARLLAAGYSRRSTRRISTA